MKSFAYLVTTALLITLAAGIASAALPAIITGKVTSAATGKPIVGAKVWTDGAGSVKTNAKGVYAITVPAGRVTICSVATGFTSLCKPKFNATSGQSATRNFILTPK